MGRNLFQYPGMKANLMLQTLLALAMGMAVILQAKWLAEAISALFAGKSLHSQLPTLASFLLAFLGRHLLSFLQQRISYAYAERTGAALRKQLMEKLFDLGPQFARTEGTGSTVTLVLEGISQFRTYLELFLPRMAGSSVIPALVLLYTFYLDRLSAVILIVTMPILIIFMILLGLAARKQMDRQWASYRVLSNHFVDALRGLETLRFLGLSRKHGDTIGRVSEAYRSATMRTLRVAFLSTFALDFITMLSIASVAVSLGLRLVNGEMVLITALTVLILAPEYFLPVRMVGADYHATLKGKDAGDAILAILGRNKAAQGTEPAASEASPASPGWTPGGPLKLELDEVELCHEGGAAVLSGITWNAEKPLKLGLIGESGAGKSTLIDILAGFLRPTGGRVRVNGEPMDLTREEWRRLVSYIPQSPYLFSATLADNIRFYKPDASMEQVEAAAQAAGLAELVEQLPAGLHEPVGNGGRSLSGGQEQRVALARAFLSDRPVILLDEPTAHLDIETEYELKETMRALFRNKLVVMATHRLHWMTEMDRILVLEKGRPAEAGTHEELLLKQGAYCRFIQSQQEGF